MKIKILGIRINTHRDEYFWAKIDWLLYKFFGKTRSIPCGRTKKDSFLCCCLPTNDKTCYISDDKHKIICKVCGHTHVMCNYIIKNISDKWNEEI